MVLCSFFIFCVLSHILSGISVFAKYSPIYIIGKKQKIKINKQNKANYPCAHYCEKKMFYSIILVGRIASVLQSTFICIFIFNGSTVNCQT